MNGRSIFKVGILVIGMIILFAAMTAALPSQILHPCHPGGGGGPGGPGGPGGGPPCPPTPVPDSNSNRGTSPLVSFRVINQSASNITLWLGDPIEYVLNVAGGSEQTFTVGRGVYTYQLAACGEQRTGFMDLTVQSFFVQASCQSEPLVRVWLENESGSRLAVMLQGVRDYVIPVADGETRSITIPRGTYDVEVMGCIHPVSMAFDARADRSLALSCP